MSVDIGALLTGFARAEAAAAAAVAPDLATEIDLLTRLVRVRRVRRLLAVVLGGAVVLAVLSAIGGPLG